MDIRKLGVLGFMDFLSGAESVEFARAVDRLGYSVLWLPDVMGREIFSFCTYILSRTERVVIGTGVAIPYAYEPIVTASATRMLGELFPDRFILGLGVSNQAANTR